MLNGVF